MCFFIYLFTDIVNDLSLFFQKKINLQKILNRKGIQLSINSVEIAFFI